MDQDKSKYIKDTPYFSLVHFQYWSSSARCFAFREWQDSYGTCLLGSGFLRPTTGSKHSASIRVDRVDLYAGPTHSAVHRTQGHRNYRSLQKNNNPPLLFPSSRSCLFKSTHRNPVGSTRTPTLRVSQSTLSLSTLSQTPSSTVPPMSCVAFCFACLQKHYLMTRTQTKPALDLISSCRGSGGAG